MVAIPAGGIPCPGIAMAKEASSAEVAPGEDFTWTVTVANPNNCLLERVSLVDTTTTSGALRYEIIGTNPNPTSRDGDTLTFTGFRPLQMGESFKVTIRARVAKDSKPLLVMHSDNDRSVPIANALTMVEILEKTGAKHTFHRYPEMGHMGINQEVIDKSLAFIKEQSP